MGCTEKEKQIHLDLSVERQVVLLCFDPLHLIVGLLRFLCVFHLELFHYFVALSLLETASVDYLFYHDCVPLVYGCVCGVQQVVVGEVQDQHYYPHCWIHWGVDC